ncbi:hypothetical protein [Larkinella sp. C7]|jgi:hypothetical protein|uniref:hypothetical protein n=1 Tax=Larkinella sp. C7 TaxID=2576607 RepID=UPI0011110277|nr:hypothetical protein [Larkinella sp. C7]
MKGTSNNIISLWFGADTPIRQFKIERNRPLWSACQRVSQVFVAPSGALTPDQYRKSDRSAFARAVLEELNYRRVPEEATYELV